MGFHGISLNKWDLRGVNRSKHLDFMGNLHHRWGHSVGFNRWKNVETHGGSRRKWSKKMMGLCFQPHRHCEPTSSCSSCLFLMIFCILTVLSVLLLWELRLLILDCLFPNISVFCFICWIVSCLIIASLGGLLLLLHKQTIHSNNLWNKHDIPRWFLAFRVLGVCFGQ